MSDSTAKAILLEPLDGGPQEADEALQAQVLALAPIADKLAKAATKGHRAAFITSAESVVLLTWVQNILDQNMLYATQLQAAEQLLGQMDAEIKRLNHGKGLWTP